MLVDEIAEHEDFVIAFAAPGLGLEKTGEDPLHTQIVQPLKPGIDRYIMVIHKDVLF